MDINSELIRCNNCILPSCYPTVSFDKSGRCSFCTAWDERWGQVNFDERSETLENVLRSFRGKAKPYDCVIGLSGGKDSCYAAYLMKKNGFSPLAVTFANGFMSEVARDNVHSIVNSLSLPHVLIEPDWALMREWYKHFFLTAGEFCSVCGIGIRAALYRVARIYNINLIVAGTSPRTEANSPKEFFTASDSYFKNVAKERFSKAEIKGFRYLNQTQRVTWHVSKTAFYLQLPNYVPWKEEEMVKEMRDNLNWSGILWDQHSDCVMGDVKEYLKLKKFGVTEKTAKFSSLIRDGQMDREHAMELIGKYETGLREKEESIREKIRKCFDISESQLDEAIRLNHSSLIPKSHGLFLRMKKMFYK